MFGFNTGTSTRPMGYQNPWSGLPTAQAPWDPSMMSPWRMSPWQTQAMPTAAPVEPVQLPQTSYLPAGTSQQIPEFQPMQPGGGFGLLPPPVAPPEQGPAAPQQAYMATGGQVFGDPFAAHNYMQQINRQNAAEGLGMAPGGAMPIQDLASVAALNPNAVPYSMDPRRQPGGIYGDPAELAGVDIWNDPSVWT